MKLLLVNNLRLPTEKAHGHQIAKMSGEFSQAGAAVNLVYPERLNKIKDDFFSFYRVEKNFSLQEVKGFDFFRLRPYLGRIVFYLQGFIFARRALKQINDKSAVIYSRSPEVVWTFARAGYKTFYECHDWLGRGRVISLWLLKGVTGIVTTNRFIKEQFVKAGVPAEKILIAPNGVNLTDFDLNLSKEEAFIELKLEDNLRASLKGKKIILYTGSFRTMGEDKGISDIILALKNLPPEVVFVAVGGNERDITFYLEQAQKEGVEERTFLLPRNTHDQLARWQLAAEVLLMPFPRKAHYEYFMTPLKMFEYMAAERPIIASDLPSIKAVLTEGSAVFCEPGDSEDLAEKIKFILNNPDLAAKLAQQARAMVDNYTWEKRAYKILDFINHG